MVSNIPFTPSPMELNIRDFFPKGTDFKKLTNRDILKVESMLNNRPRKRFQWLTPLEYAASLGVAVEGWV